MAKRTIAEANRVRRRQTKNSAATNDSATTPGGTRKPSAAWKKFAEANPGHPALNDDAIYAIPEKLLNAIKNEIKGFFKKNDEEFEKSLANHAEVGFFLRSPIFHPVLSRRVGGPGWPNIETSNEEGKETARTIREYSVEEMSSRGRTVREIEKYLAAAEAMERKIYERQAGYIGWLVTHYAFRKDCQVFQKKWQSQVRKLGRLPQLSQSFYGVAVGSERNNDSDFLVHYSTFYRRWGLDSLATWDLPVPMQPQWNRPSLYDLEGISDAGLTIFLPWHLLRDKKLQLHDLTAHELLASGPPHLADWLAKKPKNWGYERYSVMLKMYLYLELCLNRRYPKRLEGNIGKLEQAFSRFLSDANEDNDETLAAAENVRKTRLEMNRRLKNCLPRGNR